MFVHGIAHLVGFVVPWRLAELQEAPYKTTLLAGAIDVGAAGIRVVGLLWLAAALAFVMAGAGVATLSLWWRSVTVYAAVFSLALSILGWPESKYGVAINLVILALLALGARRGWQP